MANVTNWLRELRLDKYADTFTANEIDFAALPYLTEDDLRPWDYRLVRAQGARRNRRTDVPGKAGSAG